MMPGRTVRHRVVLSGNQSITIAVISAALAGAHCTVLVTDEVVGSTVPLNSPPNLPRKPGPYWRQFDKQKRDGRRK